MFVRLLSSSCECGSLCLFQLGTGQSDSHCQGSAELWVTSSKSSPATSNSDDPQIHSVIGDREAFAGLFLDITKPTESKISNSVLSYLIQR